MIKPIFQQLSHNNMISLLIELEAYALDLMNININLI
jgi:hypothetical protein